MSLHVGKTRRGKDVSLSETQRAIHTQVIGASQRGKTKFLEYAIRQDILEGRGLLLIDPHGHLYDSLVRWCAGRGYLGKRKIILFDPADERWAFGFNPFRVSSVEDLSEVAAYVDQVVEAFEQVRGGQSMDETPRLERMLRAIFHMLIAEKLTICEAPLIASPHENEIRKALAQRLRDPYFRSEWDYLNAFKPSEFEEHVESSLNRLNRFLEHPIIRRTIGQRDRVLDLGHCMDEGWVVLANLSFGRKIRRQPAQLLGVLLLSDLIAKARGREKGARPFHVYLDEAQLFANDDVAAICHEAAKFGLHLVLAHHSFAELERVGRYVRDAVIQEAQNKIVGLPKDDAEELCLSFFEDTPGAIDHRFDRATVVGHIRTWLRSYQEGGSDTWGTDRSVSRGRGGGSSRGRVSNVEGDLVTEQESEQDSSSEVESEREASGGSRSWSAGGHEVFVPVLKSLSTRTIPLEEQVYRRMQVMVTQEKAWAVVRPAGERSRVVRIQEIEEATASPERVAAGKRAAYELSGIVRSAIEVEAEIKERQECLLADVREGMATDDPQWRQPRQKAKKNALRDDE